MSVIRNDLNLCTGCKSCMTICPMDVFRFDENANKSVIAYPEECQNCAQCYINCPSRSLGFGHDDFSYALTNYR